MPASDQAKHTEVTEQSFLLMRKAYEEADASFESLNVRLGLALAFIGTSVSAAQFEIWAFTWPPYVVDWHLHLIVNALNLVSVCLFLCGTSAVVYGLQAKSLTTPYDMAALNNQHKPGIENCMDYTDLERFYRKQMANTKEAFDSLSEAIEVKGKCFNIGTTMVIFAVGLIVFGKLIL